MVQLDRRHAGNYYKMTWKLLILAGIFELNFITANVLCPKDDNSKETFLPVAENCDYFVSCGKFSEEILKCPHGLKFDAIRKICDFPEKVTCQNSFHKMKSKPLAAIQHPDCPSTDPSHPVFLRHKSDCGKFYMCSHGKAHLKICSKGLHFNERLNVCDYPANAECTKKSHKTSLAAIRYPDCPSTDPSHPIYLPHKSDCGKFYVCSHGKAHEKACSKGLHFNERLNVCDYPENAKCTEGYRIGITEANETGGATGFPSPMCPKINGKYPIFFQDAESCSVYYMCGNGHAYKFTCPSGLHFNLRKKVCDDPSRAGCLRGQNGEMKSS